MVDNEHKRPVSLAGWLDMASKGDALYKAVRALRDAEQSLGHYRDRRCCERRSRVDACLAAYEGGGNG